MTLILHFHPLASFCWKVLIALYENDTPFEPVIVDLGEEKLARSLPEAVAASARCPLLQDTARDRLVPESDHHHRLSRSTYYPGRSDLHPGRSGPGPQTHGSPTTSTTSMCTSRCRRSSATGCGRRQQGSVRRGAGARAPLAASYPMIDEDMASKQWAAGATFTLADCAAFPALLYANKVAPFAGRLRARSPRYLERLSQRPSVPRVLREAEPYIPMFPVYRPGRPEPCFTTTLKSTACSRRWPIRPAA